MNHPRIHALAYLCAICTLGCGQPEVDSKGDVVPEVAFIAPIEIDDLIRNASSPVLIEFCVPYGCFRCDAIRPQIDHLADKHSGDLIVRRINLNNSASIAMAMKISTCPTYVAFVDGSEVFRSAYPTTSDLLEGQFDALKSE